jgi:hypothetical protein
VGCQPLTLPRRHTLLTACPGYVIRVSLSCNERVRAC